MVHCIAYSSGQHTVEFGVLCMSKELSQSLENLGGAQTLPGRFSVPSISGIYTRHKRTRWAWERLIIANKKKTTTLPSMSPGIWTVVGKNRTLSSVFHCSESSSLFLALYIKRNRVLIPTFFFIELSASCSSFLADLTILLFFARTCVSPPLPSLTTVPDCFFLRLNSDRYIFERTQKIIDLQNCNIE